MGVDGFKRQFIHNMQSFHYIFNSIILQYLNCVKKGGRKMQKQKSGIEKKEMILRISKCEDCYMVEVDDMVIQGVEKYKITTSESGETEVDLKICLNTSMACIEMLTN